LQALQKILTQPRRMLEPKRTIGKWQGQTAENQEGTMRRKNTRSSKIATTETIPSSRAAAAKANERKQPRLALKYRVAHMRDTRRTHIHKDGSTISKTIRILNERREDKLIIRFRLDNFVNEIEIFKGRRVNIRK